MKKIFASIGLVFLPLITQAQNYMYRVTGREYYDYDTPPGFLSVAFLLLLPFFGIALCIAAFVFWVVMLIDAIKHAPEKLKLIWVIVIIFTNIIGALIYYFVEKRPRDLAHKEKTERKTE